MAEQAAGAVSSLLSIIRSEAQLLSGVGDDMRSIKEEMESMNSFLEYLARTAPPDRDHDEQVRTWMNQVRHLALDCNSCLDLYLYRTNPDILAARGSFGRYLCWLPWFFRGIVAQHTVATQLRQLKDRAREVSERRCRYTVEAAPVVPRLLAAGQLSSSMMTLVAATSGGGGDDEEEEDSSDLQQHVAAARGRGLFEPPLLEDYLNEKLVDWIHCQADIRSAGSVPSIAVVAPVTEDTSVTAREVSAAAAAIHHFELTVLVDIPAVHSDDLPLRPKDILFYILWGLERAMSFRSQQQCRGDNGEIIIITEEEMEEDHVGRTWKEYIYMKKLEVVDHIKEYIETRMELIDNKEINEMVIKGINNQITCQVNYNHLQLEGMLDDELECQNTRQDLMLLLLLLYRSAAAAEQAHTNQKFMPRSAEWYKKTINITARRLKNHIEAYKRLEEAPLGVRLNEAQYADILQEVLPWSSSSKPLQDQDTNNQATTTTKGTSTTTSMGEDQVRKIVNKVLQKMQEGISVKKLSTATEKNEEIQGTTTKEKTMKKTEKNEVPDTTIEEQIMKKIEEIPDTTIEEQIMKKIEEIKRKVKKQLKIKGIVDQFQNHLQNRSTLIILKIDHNCISRWEETRKALSMLGRDMRAVIVTTANNTQRAEEYCYPPQKPINYSQVGLYHDTVLQVTGQHKNDDIYFSPQIIRDILVQCERHEFCMKIFAHAMYSKPKRSNDELHELLNTLTSVSPKSLGNIAKKMLQFSYRDLSKEYRSCLLYLAIFPQGYTIRRSTLIGRWVAEGLVNRGDWPTSVGHAERCFEALVDRYLVHPASIGATGKVKSCKVGELVHRFIKKIARRQGILETHLSDHLARHFSIFNDIQLGRRYDTIQDFLRMLSKSSQLSLLKVLDLEGCNFLGERHYLKNICSKILLLKYLSLRKTNFTYLPFEINNLRELEVLDIRQTKIPQSSTRDLCLLKLKRLLAGNVDPNYNSIVSSTYIPEKVYKLLDMEVLSGVRPRTSQELKGIGMLWQLRKLGVVIEDKETHLRSLIYAISNLSDCIQSVSITLVPKTKNTPSKGRLLSPDDELLRNHPQFLKSLTISGSTKKVNLLDALFLGNENSPLTKITLSNTTLRREDLVVLSKLHKLHCVKLRCNSYAENKITFKNNEFKNLKYFLIEGSMMTEIIFDHGAANLKKMVLPLSDGLNLSGLEKLQRLEELELNDNNNKDNKTTSSNNNNDINNSGSIATATTTVAANPTNDTTTVAAHIAAAAVTPNTNSNDATTHTTDATVDAAVSTAAISAANASTATATTAATGIDTITATTTDTASVITAATTVTTASIPDPTDSNIIKNNMLRSLFDNAKGITKVTLRGTMLRQDGLQILATKPNIHCLVLLDKSYDESQLTFGKKDFPKLNLLTVKCSNITKISFAPGSCCKLEKFIWTFNFTNMELLTGIGNLLRLKEVEFNGEFVHDEVKEEIEKHKNKPYFTHYKPEKDKAY